MKKLFLLIIITFLLLIYSCGLLDSENHSKAVTTTVLKIYSINIDGSNLKLLSGCTSFIVSQTRDSIFYTDNNSKIYYINSDGTNNHLLTSGSFYGLRLASTGIKYVLYQRLIPIL